MGNAVHDKGDSDDQGERPLVETQGTQTRHCDISTCRKSFKIILLPLAIFL